MVMVGMVGLQVEQFGFDYVGVMQQYQLVCWVGEVLGVIVLVYWFGNWYCCDCFVQDVW